MADITVDSTALVNGSVTRLWGPYWADDSVALIVAINSSQDLTFYRTFNGGSTWSETPVAGSARTCAAYYDAEEPNLTSNLVHVVWQDDVDQAAYYMNLNLANNTFSNAGTPYTIVSATAFSTSSSVQSMFIVRTRNGNLLTGWKDTNITAMDTLKSTDTGATWSSIDEVWDGTTSHDLVIGVPCNTDDDADGAVLYWDRSTDEITIKVYDDSVNNWVESTVSTGMVEPGPEVWNWSVATFRSNGKVFLAAFDDVDGTAPDLKTWLLDINSVSSPSVTAKTSVLTATDEAVCPAVFIDPRTDEIYVCYLTGTAYQATLNPFYKKSSDTGGTWGSAVALSDAAEDDYRALSVGSTCFTNGGKMMPVWMDDDDSDLLTSVFADVVLTSDVLVEGSANANGDRFSQQVKGPYWISDQVGALIYTQSAGTDDLVARKSTDGGQTWSSVVAVEAGTVYGFACWFDGQIPGNTNGKIRCAWMNDGDDDFSYAAFDINAGTWSSVVDIDAAASVSSFVTSHSIFIVGTLAGGFVSGYVNSGTGSGCYKSADGSSWSSCASPWESNALDMAIGMLADTGDTADAAIAFFDNSANAISIKMYDDSGDAWTETAVSSASYTDTHSLFAATTRHSDSHSILTAWTAKDFASADLKVWDLNLNSISSPTVTAKTDVLTDSPESQSSGVFIDQSNDGIYAVYARGTSVGDTQSIYYKQSTDGGASWGSEQQYSQQIQDDFRTLHAGAMAGSSAGGRFMPAFFDDDDNDIFVNYNNSVSIAAASSFDPATGFAPQQPFPSIPDWRRVPAIAY